MAAKFPSGEEREASLGWFITVGWVCKQPIHDWQVTEDKNTSWVSGIFTFTRVASLCLNPHTTLWSSCVRSCAKTSLSMSAHLTGSHEQGPLNDTKTCMSWSCGQLRNKHQRNNEDVGRKEFHLHALTGTGNRGRRGDWRLCITFKAIPSRTAYFL